MSIYYRGRDCDRKEECIRYQYGKRYNGQSIEGLWYVDEPSCKKNWYDDYVDHDGQRAEKWRE